MPPPLSLDTLRELQEEFHADDVALTENMRCWSEAEARAHFESGGTASPPLRLLCLHGGGANTTTSEWRRGMFFGLVVGWLRTEENFFLTVPIDKVRTMPKRAQELLGYKAHCGIGVVDVGSPMVMLD